MNRFRDDLSVPFVMGIGGTLDVMAGYVRRAPVLVQKLGLEWAFRAAQEPRRLAWRYLRTNVIFAGLILSHVAGRMAGSAAKS
jgi:N-acetylglucosaminyldiphosphoundecaprenol N-acetyl-beta-D-mannosaminyltransferase